MQTGCATDWCWQHCCADCGGTACADDNGLICEDEKLGDLFISMKASNTTYNVACCNDGTLTPATCGPGTPCETVCGDIDCARIVTDISQQDNCKSGDNHFYTDCYNC